MEQKPKWWEIVICVLVWIAIIYGVSCMKWADWEAVGSFLLWPLKMMK